MKSGKLDILANKGIIVTLTFSKRQAYSTRRVVRLHFITNVVEHVS